MKQSALDRYFPLVLLAILVISFGLLIPVLGLYWDDWPAVTLARLRGVGAFWNFYQGERPFSAWTYILTMPILGTTPWVWHIFALLLRWLAVLAMWWCLRGLWPRQKSVANWMAILFAIYPVFTYQPVAVAFSQHWITFGLFFVSIGAMIWAERMPRRFYWLTALALISQALHMLTMEYFWGLELLRPLLLWIVLTDQEMPTRQRINLVVRRWLPYLAVFMAALLVRMVFFVNLKDDPNRPDLLYRLANQPLATLLQLLQLSIQDFTHNLIGAWYETARPDQIDLTDRVYLFSIVAGVAAASLTCLLLKKINRTGESQVEATPGWLRQALLVGLIATFLGPLPVWLTDRSVLWGMWGGRFALAAMFGLSILFYALLVWFTPRRLPILLLVSTLVGFAVGYHLRNATEYYRSTLKQNQFYWQLYWRAPSIQPNTAILSADELFSFVGRASTAMALNLLYPQPESQESLGYWFLELAHDIGPKQVPRLARGKPLNPTFRNFTFQGNSLDSLVIYYKSGTGRCLWVLSPEDADNPALPELTVQALPVSNLSRISPEPSSDIYPPTDLFGKEPPHDWCYYFQKADLMRQLGDWESVANLGDEAAQNGYKPADANEWIPFIQGYAHSDQWEKAVQRSQDAKQSNEEVTPRLCRIWQEMEDIVPAEHLQELEQFLTESNCLDE